MFTMIMIGVMILWTLGSIAYLIAAFLRGYEVLDPAFFCAIVWAVLAATTGLTGMAEKQYHQYHSGVNYEYATRMA